MPEGLALEIQEIIRLDAIYNRNLSGPVRVELHDRIQRLGALLTDKTGKFNQG